MNYDLRHGDGYQPPAPTQAMLDDAMQKIERLRQQNAVLRAEVKASRCVTDMAAECQNHGVEWNVACKNRRIAREATDAASALHEQQPGGT